MTKYRVTCYPNRESYIVDVEAESIEEAIEYAEQHAQNDAFFTGEAEDVEVLNDDE